MKETVSKSTLLFQKQQNLTNLKKDKKRPYPKV